MNQHSSPYTIVEFIDRDECEAVPTAWIVSDKGSYCSRWPPFAGASRLVEAITSRTKPAHNWLQYDVRILGHAGRL